MKTDERTKCPVYANAPDEGALRRFVELLNKQKYWSASLIPSKRRIGGDYRPIQSELRGFVSAWRRSGPNVCKLFDANPLLSHSALDFRPHFIPTPRNTARLAYQAAVEYSEDISAREIAVELFLRFLLNPYNEKLGGPCKYCDEYFMKKTKRQTVYCSELCGQRFTSRKALEDSRKRETARKIKEAKQSIAEWLDKGLSKDWKDWVSRRTLISKNWLTRAIKNDLIKEPVKKLS